MTLEAVIFGGMGSLAECAEMDRRAWNAAFSAHGVDWTWSWDVYSELMRAGGDKQAVDQFCAARGEEPPISPELLDRTHQRHFVSMLADDLPLRPGVARVLAWSVRAGLKIGFVSRSGEDPVRALLQATARVRAGISFDVAVLRGDVRHVAPHPEAMTRAIEQLDVGRARAVVVADSAVTAKAAQDAGLSVLAFPSALASSDMADFGTLPVARVLSPEALTGAWSRWDETAAE